jgi:hypothetical protein
LRTKTTKLGRRGQSLRSGSSATIVASPSGRSSSAAIGQPARHCVDAAFAEQHQRVKICVGIVAPFCTRGRVSD